MTHENEFKPFLVNDRSSALINFIDASQFSESELVDVYLGLCDRLKHLIDLNPTIGFEIPSKPLVIEEPQIEPPTQESLQEGFKAYLNECKSEEEILFKVLPIEASMLLGVVQSAVINHDIPENIERFCRNFIGQFGNRHRDKYPAIVDALLKGWSPHYQGTREEFDFLMGDFSTDDRDDVTLDDQSFKDVPLGKWVPTLSDFLNGNEEDDDHDYVDDFA
ncbi:hypothetical protein B9G53_14385 [Pseudanabaena sp. SR411]|uniref:hypothetical protein n=1 Tax=Pseudanabaena sp. SR411 TaxID=1980935 RepID=UPI000B9945BE|nr:hypothetical protein [Pseudanabaena sp. SR411]OYQ63934.1 hypothetical protein B9G53_14385 [Pseudanabaena sp. SR411]